MGLWEIKKMFDKVGIIQKWYRRRVDIIERKKEA